MQDLLLIDPAFKKSAQTEHKPKGLLS